MCGAVQSVKQVMLSSSRCGTLPVCSHVILQLEFLLQCAHSCFTLARLRPSDCRAAVQQMASFACMLAIAHFTKITPRIWHMASRGTPPPFIPPSLRPSQKLCRFLPALGPNSTQSRKTSLKRQTHDVHAKMIPGPQWCALLCCEVCQSPRADLSPSHLRAAPEEIRTAQPGDLEVASAAMEAFVQASPRRIKFVKIRTLAAAAEGRLHLPLQPPRCISKAARCSIVVVEEGLLVLESCRCIRISNRTNCSSLPPRRFPLC